MPGFWTWCKCVYVQYAIGVRMMFQGVSEGEPQVLSEAIRHLQADADQGNAHAQSTLAFLLGIGYGTEQSNPKAFLLHHFAAEGGNFQSKMALAYSYSRQQVWLDSRRLPILRSVRAHYNSEERFMLHGLFFARYWTWEILYLPCGLCRCMRRLWNCMRSLLQLQWLASEAPKTFLLWSQFDWMMDSKKALPWRNSVGKMMMIFSSLSIR